MWIISKWPISLFIKGVIICNELKRNREKPKKKTFIAKMSQKITIHYPWIFSEFLVKAFKGPSPKDSILTLHIKTFEQLFWRTTRRNHYRKAQWQTQSRYLCHCAFFVLFCDAGSEKTWPNHFISISRALVALASVLRQ